MNAHDPKLEQRLAELRGVAEPMPVDKRRVLASVRAVLDLQSGSPPAPGAPPAIERSLNQGSARVAPSARATARSLRPWLGGALIGGVVGLALGLRLAREGERATEATRLERSGVAQAVPTGSASSELRASAPAPEVSAPSAIALVARGGSGASQPGAADELAQPPARKVSQARSRAAASGTERRPSGESIDLALALELLQRAEQALHASEPQLALGVLSDLDRRARRALLREERLTTSALVLCELDRPGEARALREELQREFPGSIYAQRLAQSCAIGSAASATPLPKISPGSAKSRDLGH